MAKIITGFDWNEHHGVGDTKYPWDKWLDGKTRKLVQGEDFDCTLQAFRINMYRAAKKRGKRLRSKFEGEDTIIFQAFDREAEE